MFPLSSLRFGRCGTKSCFEEELPRFLFNKRFHVLLSHPAIMAKGWRGLLEEESEHQWLAMGGFLVFILIGALLIQGTSSLPGVDYRTNGLDEMDGRVLDIIYGDSDTYTALVLNNGEAELFHVNQAGEIHDIGGEYPDVLGLNFITQLHDGSIVVSPQNNTLDIVHVNAEVEQRTVLSLNDGQEAFDILDLAEQKSEESYRWLVVTDEGDSTGLRGFGPVGSELLPVNEPMKNADLTSPTLAPANIDWKMVESLGDGQWIAVGSMGSVFGSDDSPATPTKHPGIGFITWNDGPTAPMLTSIEEIDKGEIHSLIRLHNGTILAAGTDSAVHIAKDRTTTAIDVASVSSSLDENGKVWMLGSKGSTSVMRLVDGEMETLPLSRPIPLNVEVSDVSNDVLYAHGVNNNGDPVTYSIDTLAIGSIESGRGFLNLMFVGVSSVVLGVMLWIGSKRLIQNQ